MVILLFLLPNLYTLLSFSFFSNLSVLCRTSVTLLNRTAIVGILMFFQIFTVDMGVVDTSLRKFSSIHILLRVLS